MSKIEDPTLIDSKLTVQIHLSTKEAAALRSATRAHGRSTWSKMAKDILTTVLAHDLVKAVLDE
jgi:hypothetical protein